MVFTKHQKQPKPNSDAYYHYYYLYESYYNSGMEYPSNFKVGKVGDDLSTLRSNLRSKAREKDIDISDADLEDFEEKVMKANEEAEEEGIDESDDKALGEFFLDRFGTEEDEDEEKDDTSKDQSDFEYWSRVEDTNYEFEWEHDSGEIKVIVERTGNTSWSAGVIESGELREQIVEDMLDPEKAMFRAEAWIKENDEKSVDLEDDGSEDPNGSEKPVDYDDLYSKLSSDVSGDEREFAEQVLERVDNYDLDKDVEIAEDLTVETVSGVKYAAVRYNSGKNKVVGFQYNPRMYDNASERQKIHTVLHEAVHFRYHRHNKDFYNQLIDLLESEGMWTDENKKFVEEDIRANSDYLSVSSVFEDYDGLTVSRVESFMKKYMDMRGMIERDFDVSKWDGMTSNVHVEGEGDIKSLEIGRGRGKSRLKVAEISMRDRVFDPIEDEYWVFVDSIDKEGNIEWATLSNEFSEASEQLENSKERVKQARKEKRYANKSMNKEAVSELTQMGVIVSKNAGKIVDEEFVEEVGGLEAPPMYINPDVVRHVNHGIRSDSVKYDNIEITGSIPKFMGVDGEFYGAFDGGERLTLPEENAEILVNRGNAEYLEEQGEETTSDMVTEVQGKVIDDTWKDYHRVVNMGTKDLEERLEGSCKNKASGDDRDEHIKRNKFILNTSKDEWGTKKVPEEFALDPSSSPAKSRLVVHQARRTVAFAERHLAQLKNERVVISEDGCYNPRVEGLRNWAIDPMRIEGISADEDRRKES